MAKSIIDYQKAYKEITESLKKNTNIYAIFVFGSMVSGDLWEGSDIDLFVIYKDDFDHIRDVYTEIVNIPIHIRFLSKDKFINDYKKPGKREKIKASLILSKMIYCIDDEIKDLYEKTIYIIEEDKGRLNLVYLGNFLKQVGVCKKYLNNGNKLTTHELLLKSLNSFSMLYLSINGYTVSKDSLSMACNLNDNLSLKVNKFLKEENNENIIDIIRYMEKYLEDNLEKAGKEIIDFLKKEKKSLSSFEIKQNEYFRNFKIELEEILNLLYENNFLIKEKRVLKDFNDNFLAKENIYTYKN